MALEDFQLALKVNPPSFDATKPLLAAAEYNRSLAQTRDIHATANRREYDQGSEELSRAAKSIAMEPEGPRRTAAWNYHVDDLHKRGYLSAEDRNRWHNNPSNLVLEQAIARGTNTAQHSAMTGETAGNDAAARYPYQTQEHAPTSDVVRPSQIPGAPMRPAGRVMGGPQIAPSPSGGPGGSAGSGMIPPPSEQPIAPASPTQGVARVQPNSNQAQARADEYSDPIYQEVPKLPPKVGQPSKPGVVLPAKTSPVQIKQEEAAVENYNDKILKPAQAATETRAGFGTMRSALNDVNTGRTGPIRAAIAGWMLEAGVDARAIQARTGINPISDEIMKKESVQDSMKFVRETIGAREALQAIQAVMSAFPHNSNSKEANMAMIDIMDASSKWREDRQKFADAFIRKNDHLPVNERLDGFNRWFSENYPMARYVSEVVPYNVPLKGDGEDKTINPSKLEKNVIYKMPDGTPLMYRGNNKWTPPPGRAGGNQ